MGSLLSTQNLINPNFYLELKNMKTFISYKSFEECIEQIKNYFSKKKIEFQFFNSVYAGGDAISIIVPNDKSLLSEESKKQKKIIQMIFKLVKNTKKLDPDLQCLINDEEEYNWEKKEFDEFSIKLELSFSQIITSY